MSLQAISKHVCNFLHDEGGASSSEYALILGVIGAGVGAATLVLGANVGASMNSKAAGFDPDFVDSTGSPGGSNGSNSGGNGGSGTGGNTGGGSGGATDPGGGNTEPGNGNNGNGNGNGGTPKGGGNGKNK